MVAQTTVSALTMRATVRNYAPGLEDDWGHATQGAVTDRQIPCYAWYPRGSAAVEVIGADVQAVVRMPQMMVVQDEPLEETEQVLQIADRLGTVRFEGPFEVKGIAERPAGRHKVATLRRIE